METVHNFVVFTLDDNRYALHEEVVERVVHMVEITLLSKSLQKVLGVINVQGHIIPVIDTREVFGLPAKKIGLNDQLIIVRAAKATAALVVDTVTDVITCAEKDFISAEKSMLGVKSIEGVLKLENGLILVHNLDVFLSQTEEKGLHDVDTQTLTR